MSSVSIDSLLMEEFKKRYFFKEAQFVDISKNKFHIGDNIIFQMDYPYMCDEYFRQDRHLFDYYYIHAGRPNSLPFSALCKILDIDLEAVKDYLYSYERLIRKKFLAFIGFGGAVCNLLQFIEYFKKETNLYVYLAGSDPIIYEGDTVEFHNMFRIYDYRLLDLYRPFINPVHTDESSHLKINLIPNLKAIKFDRYIDEDFIRNIPSDSIWVGAPDIATRELFRKYNKNLLLFVHKDHNGYIGQNITVTGLETETYGKINVPILLLNILKMTENFLKYCYHLHHALVSDSDFNSFTEPDKLVFEFNAVDFLRNKYSKLKANQSNNSGTVEFEYSNSTYSIFIK